MGNQGFDESDDGNLIVYFQEKEHSYRMTVDICEEILDYLNSGFSESQGVRVISR